MNKFEEIQAIVNATEADAVSFYIKGNKAAGTRVRAALLKIKDLAHEGRKDISDIKSK